MFQQDKDGTAADGEDYTCTAEFKPVVKLKPLEEVKTGEEDEQVGLLILNQATETMD